MFYYVEFFSCRIFSCRFLNDFSLIFVWDVVLSSFISYPIFNASIFRSSICSLPPVLLLSCFYRFTIVFMRWRNQILYAEMRDLIYLFFLLWSVCFALIFLFVEFGGVDKYIWIKWRLFVTSWAKKHSLVDWFFRW